MPDSRASDHLATFCSAADPRVTECAIAPPMLELGIQNPQTPSSAATRERPRRWPTILLSTLWFALTPLALATVLVAYGLPSRPGEDDAGRWAAWHGWLHDQIAVVWVLVASGAAVWLHLVRSQLPGARWLVAGAPAPRGLSPQQLAAWDVRHGSRPRSGRGALSACLWTGAGALLALLLRAFVLGLFSIPSSSMAPTLLTGDVVLVNKLAFGTTAPLLGHFLPRRAPGRGEAVVLANDQLADVPFIAKRVVGLPGDRIRMDRGHAVINGKRVPHCDVGVYSYASVSEVTQARLFVERLDGRSYLAMYSPLYREFEGEYLVKDDELFVLGDNRNISADSRALNGGKGGGYPVDRVEGRVASILVSREASEGWSFARSRVAPTGPGVASLLIADKTLRTRTSECLQTPSQWQE